MKSGSNLPRAKLLEFPERRDARGALAFAEVGREIPFEIRRAYWIFDTPAGAERGAHGHRALEQVMIALAGAVTVTLDDGENSRSFRLDRATIGLYVPPMLWRDLDAFEPGTACLIMASEYYDEADYFRDYSEYVTAARELAAHGTQGGP